MKKKIKLLILVLCGTAAYLQAQQKFTVSGTLKDQTTGETMVGTTVYPVELPSLGTNCNEHGFYSLTLPSGTYRLVYRFIGYKVDTVLVELQANVSIDRLMEPEMLDDVLITDDGKDANLRETNVGVEKLDIKAIEKIPVFGGEKDIYKVITLLPGVKSGGEGNSGFFVRGGSADQNLVLLDEAPVYNASHLLGFFSTFNSDALKSVSIIKGNSPSQYGGRLSSVLDVKMKEGNNQKYHVTGGIGLISSRLSIEGPIQKDKSSFMIAGRRTYADVFLKVTEDFKENKLYFYDLNAKANLWINEKNRIFLSGYFGSDKLGFGSTFGIDWGNKTATLRWNSLLSPKLFSNTSLIYSDYSYNIKINSGGTNFHINSKIRDWNLKEEFQLFPNAKNSLRFGFNSIYHTVQPSRFEGESVEQDDNKNSRHSLENAVFVNNTTKLGTRLSVDYGLRLSLFTIVGGNTYNTYTNGVLTDSLVLASGELGKTYTNIEPRAQFSYMLGAHSSLKGGYARNTQNLHLLSNSTSASPTDQWIASSYNIKPEISDQLSLGFFQNFDEGRYNASIETYYKQLQNQVDYKNGADINSAPDIESELLFGKGRAYGVEFLLKKAQGKFTGWVGYTLSRTERKIDGISNNNWYVARQDRTHDLSVVGMYDISARWSLSGLFVYSTGNATTFPSGKYSIEGNTVYYYTERNGYRMPAYHRLDFGATYSKPHKKNYESSWNFSIYNAYGRRNAYTITFEDDPDEPGRTRVIKTSLFRWIPSVTYNFKF